MRLKAPHPPTHFLACRLPRPPLGRRAPLVARSAVNVSSTKSSLKDALQGLDRGIFGVQATKRQAVHQLIESLEAQNPLESPTENLDRVEGAWRLLYTTITISGARKTKLGLREFIKLGDFTQTIDTSESKAINEVQFRVAGLGTFGGALTITAGYTAVGPQRVDISFQEASLVPQQLQKLFEKNYDLLLSVFNPEGWLDITYVDDELRVGRDDKGNIFVLERC